MSFLSCPHLPTRPITSAVVSCEVSLTMRKMLEKRGVRLFSNGKNPTLPTPVSSHPDLSVFDMGGGKILVDRAAELELPHDVDICMGSIPLTGVYPGDIAYDACQIGQFLFCNPKYTAPEILQLPLNLVPVKQGYTKCSVAIVSEKAAITEDIGIAQMMDSVGIDVLKLEPGFVKLPGYSHGFIGGASGKIASDILAFFGDISQHPQGDVVIRFCEKHGVSTLSLSDDELTDFGSLIPLTE